MLAKSPDSAHKKKWTAKVDLNDPVAVYSI